MSRVKKSVMVQKLLETNPTLTVLAVAKKLGISRNYVYKIKSTLKGEVEDVLEEKVIQEEDAPTLRLRIQRHEEKMTVNHPPHYKVGGIETIDFIEAKGLDYCLGNAVKYITRAEHKGNKKEDLLKAQWYLTRVISKI